MTKVCKKCEKDKIIDDLIPTGMERAEKTIC